MTNWQLLKHRRGVFTDKRSRRFWQWASRKGTGHLGAQLKSLWYNGIASVETLR